MSSRRSRSYSFTEEDFTVLRELFLLCSLSDEGCVLPLRAQFPGRRRRCRNRNKPDANPHQTQPSSERIQTKTNIDLQGRPGEWAALTLPQIVILIEKQAKFLICKYHKTAWKYGEAGKYVPPSLRKAFETYVALPRDALNRPSGELINYFLTFGFLLS